MHGPEANTLGNNTYFITFIDDATREMRLYPMKAKYDSPAKFKEYKAWVENHRNGKVRTLQSDNGGEYLSSEFQAYLRGEGIVHHRTVPRNLQENGVAERRNRTLLERTKAFIFEASLPESLWGEAIHHVEYVMNRLPTKLLDNITPYEAATGKKPDLSRLPLWGEEVWVHVTTTSKLAPRAEKGRWVGFDSNSQGHRIYMKTGHVKVERNVRFIRHTLDPPGIVLDEGDIPEVAQSLPAPKPVKTNSVSDHTETEHGTTVGSESGGDTRNLTDSSSSSSDAENTEIGDEHDVQPQVAPNLAIGRPRRAPAPSRYVRDIQSGVGSATGRAGDTQLPKGLRSANVSIRRG